MTLTGLEIYKKILPKTNCGDCGITSCFTFATMVATCQLPLDKCPHINPETLEAFRDECEELNKGGKSTKKDPADDALEWAKKRSTSMKIEDLPKRIGGTLKQYGDDTSLELPYFTGAVLIRKDSITKTDGSSLNHWEQVFIYNHIAQGGQSNPTGTWISLRDIPNATPKIESMKSCVEEPLVRAFKGRKDKLIQVSKSFGGIEIKDAVNSAELSLLFQPLPKVPLMLLYWDAIEEEGFDAEVRMVFDETIPEHLDIESILFLCERLRELLCGYE